MRNSLKDTWMKHFFTSGVIVLTGQLGFAGAYFLKFIGSIAIVFMKMMEIRDLLYE